MSLKRNQIPLLFAFCYVVLFFFVKDNPFFWDTIQLGSKHAHWYFENDFQYFFLPEYLDSGHPPTFGIGLAGLWKIFGKQLWVGHAMILPFSIGIVFLLYKLGVFFLGEKNAGYLLLLTTVDAFLAGQSALVSPDIPLLFFLLLSLWSVVHNRKVFLMIAAIGLASLSMRGMMLVVVVYLFNLVWKYINGEIKINLPTLFKQTFPYIPSGILALVFLYVHYQHTGWIGYHENSSWAPAFAKVDARGLVKNVAVLGWRFLDFGRVVLCLVLVYVALKWWVNNWKPSKKGQGLILLFIISFIVLIPSLLIHQNLLAHRYLLPLVIILHFLFIYFLFCQPRQHLVSKYLFYLAFIGMFAGNLLVYPKKISQGWDSTLAHLSYFSLRTQMIEFIDQNRISLEDIGTDYPENGPVRFIDLSDRTDSFVTHNLEKQQYILYSNVMNEFSDETIDKLETEWLVLKQFEHLGVCIILYKKN